MLVHLILVFACISVVTVVRTTGGINCVYLLQILNALTVDGICEKEAAIQMAGFTSSFLGDGLSEAEQINGCSVPRQFSKFN